MLSSLIIIYFYCSQKYKHIYLMDYVKFQYTQAMIHSIQNADGTVSIIQVDPNNQIITLPDGTTAQVQGVATVCSLIKEIYINEKII